MTANDIIEELKTLGSATTKNTFMKHGAKEPFYGVKVEDLKKIQKKVKKNHALSLELYNSGVSDAMYLAGLISEPMKMTKAELQTWAENSTWYMIAEYTVPWTASESRFGMELALEWIKSTNEKIASTGWATLGSILSIKPNAELDLKLIQQLVDHVAANIQNAPNRVRYTMNNFVIAVGGYCPELTDYATDVSKKIGVVFVDVGDTSCKVPYAPDYIQKMVARGSLGKKRKTAFC